MECSWLKNGELTRKWLKKMKLNEKESGLLDTIEMVNMYSHVITAI